MKIKFWPVKVGYFSWPWCAETIERSNGTSLHVHLSKTLKRNNEIFSGNFRQGFSLKSFTAWAISYTVSLKISIGLTRAEECPFTGQIDADLAHFSAGITEESMQNLKGMSNLIQYQIISGVLYRTENCQAGSNLFLRLFLVLFKLKVVV